jgi:4-amino-4-deoxy-L-arabinose transferase-like glycosyltransferase
MSCVPGDPATTAELQRQRLALLGLALIYALGHLAWYGATPMGGFPVLDGREIIDMAKAMAANELPAEPFYRAPLYPAVLALLLALGWPESGLPDAARIVNLLAHLASVLMVFELARRVWRSTRAGQLAAGAFALYPVLLHFAGDPFDVTFASSLAIGATLVAWLAIEHSRPRMAALAGFLMALAVMARPHFTACLPLLVLALPLLANQRRWQIAGASLAGITLVLALMGGVNFLVGNQFRVLPWQGSHGLWDGNGAGADGLSYRHSIPVPDLGPGVNPARYEAEIVFCRELDCARGFDIDAFADFWREKTIRHVVAHPREWLQLMGTKVRYLVNQYEQYNNKTYWVHKQRSPWLRYNPLGWAMILALAAGALCLPMRAQARWLFLGLIAAYSVSLLLYFVSARFRVSLVGWLCVLSGGWAVVHAQRHALQISRMRLGVGTVSALLVFVMAAWPVPTLMREQTISMDWTLLAEAALSAGDWQQGEHWSQRVLAQDPGRSQAYTLVCMARFTAWETADDDQLPPEAWLAESLRYCELGAGGSDRAGYHSFYFLSALCRRAEATEVLRRLQHSALVAGNARDALQAMGVLEPDPTEPPGALRRMQLQSLDTLRPGLRSILMAIESKQCPPSEAAGRSR